MKKRGFTLIELLVVITIIALLVSILMPALSKAKDQARQIVCATSLKSQIAGIIIYTSQNNGKVPIIPDAANGWWVWDMNFRATNMISKLAGFQDNEVFFCSSNKQNIPTDARWWQFTWVRNGGWPYSLSAADYLAPIPLEDESQLTSVQQGDNYRVMSFIYMFDKNAANGQPNSEVYPEYVPRSNTSITMKNTWVKNVDRVKLTADKEFVCDLVLCEPASGSSPSSCYGQDYNFFEITVGGSSGASGQSYGVLDRSNHMGRLRRNGSKLPSGGNVGYVDGHVGWKKLEQMDMRINQTSSVTGVNLHWWF